MTHYPDTPEKLAFFDHLFAVRRSSRKSWRGLREAFLDDPEVIDNKRLSSFLMIEGNTNRPVLNAKFGQIICSNNPYYRRAYLRYLESLYATGIDGIMTDDVGMSFYGCVCKYCRRDFREQTGFEIPPPGNEFAEWAGDYSSLSFRKYMDFKMRKVEEFHFKVKTHYESLGLRMLRPAYVAKILKYPRNVYCYQNLPAVDWGFQEAGGAHILQYSWPQWGVEQAVQFALARYKNVPSMLMTYPTRRDNLILSWALAMSWGSLFTGTVEGNTNPLNEKFLRNFEIRHRNMLYRPEKISKLGFYDSLRNRELSPQFSETGGRQLKCWALSCLMENLPFDIFETEELTARLPEYHVVVLNEISYLSQWELLEFRKFVMNGGTLVWTGNTGKYGDFGTERRAEYLGTFWGIDDKYFNSPLDADSRDIRIGGGRLILADDMFGVAEFEQEYFLDWWRNDLTCKPRVPFKALSAEAKEIRKQSIDFLKNLLPDGSYFECENLPEGVLVSMFMSRSRNAFLMHIVNTSGVLDLPDGQMISHDDHPIPFPSHAGKPEVNIKFKTNLPIKNARAYNLYSEVPANLNLQCRKGNTKISLPPEQLKDYLLIEICGDDIQE